VTKPGLNWIDRTIAYFSPERGAARAQARAMMGVLLAYDGARMGRRTDGWTTVGSSGDAEVGNAHRLMRDRARDLVRNNPHAAKGLAVIVANKIGTGIMCQPSEKAKADGSRPNQRKNQRLHDRWKRWVDRCDIAGKHDFYGIQSLLERTRAESGEALLRFVPTKMVDDDDVPFRVQVLEPDHIDSDRNFRINERSEVRYGVEYQNQKPVAYWLFGYHPGDASSIPLRGTLASQRVPATEVLHYFKALRANQTRGITDFAPVMLRLRDLDDWHDAKLMRAKISACSIAAVTTNGGLPGSSLGPTATDDNARRIETFNPGMFHHMRPGESVTFFDPKPLDDSKFNSDELHAISAGLGIPYELLTGDLIEVNYTSHRGGLVQFRGMIEADQWQVVVPQICDPVTRRFAAEAVGVDGMIDPYAGWTYTPPRFGLLDPAKEIPATIAAIQGGLESLPNALRRDGYDWMEKLDEIQAANEECDRRKLKLTSDGRTQIKPAAGSEGANASAA
jgi:lambda family phage portal protein